MGLLALLALGAALTLAAVLAAVVSDARYPARASVGWALGRGLPTCPSDAGMESTDGTVTCDDGTVLPMWIIRGGKPDGPALLMLHGWRRSRIDSLRRLPWLLPHVRCACVMDLRGHGDAPAGPSTLGTTDVADACSAVRAYPNVPWIVSGHSLGAAVAIRAAAALHAAGERIQGALLMCPYPDIEVPLAGRLRAIGMPAVPVAGLAARAIAALHGSEAPIGAALRTIGHASMPTVWIACAGDAVVPEQAVRKLHYQARALGSAATLHVDTHRDHDSVGTGCPSWAADALSALTRRSAVATTS